MKAIIGYIPAAVVLVPMIVAIVRQSLFYKGCMDGIGYIMVATMGFAIGGLLNLGFLLFVLLAGKTFFSFPEGWRATAAKGSVIVASCTFVLQIGVVAFILWQKSMN